MGISSRILVVPYGIRGRFTKSEFQLLGSLRLGDRLDHREKNVRRPLRE